MAPLRIPRFALFGDRPPLTEDERRLVLRVIALTSIPLALIVMGVLIVGGAFAYHELHNRTVSNSEAIKNSQEAITSVRALAELIESESMERENAIAWRVYDECVENENQDVTYAELFRTVRAASIVAQRESPTPERQALIEKLNETIDAREPPGEAECPIPEGERP